MALNVDSSRLSVVNELRSIQRQWLASTRERVANGEPFGICNGDEFEEVFIAMDIPVLAINYWNYLILAQRKAGRMTEILRDAGYPGEHFFGFGLASTLSPEDAPWGGLPNPTILCGSTRNEMELRVCEVWAESMGCPIAAMDFSFPSPHFETIPRDWWRHLELEGEAMVDPDRLQYRVELERDLIKTLERMAHRTLDVTDLSMVMCRINEQMQWWGAAQDLIAEAPRCPVHIRDQMSMYQAMWHRGTERGVSLVRSYYEEVRARVDAEVGAYPDERFRLYYSVQAPPWHSYVERETGAVTVACSYTRIPDLYRRTFDPSDPLRALAARHMFLFDWGPYRIIDVAKAHRCDAAIVVEPARGAAPSVQQEIVEAAGIPYLAIPRATDDAEIRDMITTFIADRLR